jgi:hypothetical protein
MCFIPPLASAKVKLSQFTDVSARIGRQHLNDISSTFPVEIKSSDSFIAKDFPNVSGKIMAEHGQMIQELLKETDLKFLVSCNVDVEPNSQKSSRNIGQVPCTLDITLYGPIDLFEDIDTWFQGYETYLQDPQVCHMDVKYCNPHRLSSNDLESCPLLSEFISQTAKLIQLQDIGDRPDLLDALTSQMELEESPQPTVIYTTLQR